jgi:hypothetical protein
MRNFISDNKLFIGYLLFIASMMLLPKIVEINDIFQESDQLAVSPIGEISNPIDKRREYFQGVDFWRRQLVLVQKMIDEPDEILVLLKLLAKADVVAENASQITDDIVTNDPYLKEYYSSNSYQLQKSAEHFTRLSESSKKVKILTMAYYNSIEKQAEYKVIQAFIESKISSAR